MLSDRDLCDGAIICPQESERERERDLSVSVISCNNNRVHPNWVGRAGETNEEGKKMHYKVHRTSPC